ncbi:Tetratricopeptide repeat-containing protein [Mesonia phycicola]|uniref:Tetratricopeptide repeat-containing protein n=1 Tax=Mesonia phycicola TaxID=579105 RepID=A0A1M6B001_9FLAO|nr:tetratricopeptide repeat protein [Mesonia phycicola]SHI42036.1 Tetratricopeptide repeat-containing protein [Mesonia phycicola]
MKKHLLYLFILFSIALNAQTSFKKGVEFFDAENWESAKTHFNQVESSNSYYLKAQEYLGDIAAHQKEWDEALNFYETLVEAHPDNANYNFKYGGALGLKALTLSKMQAAFYISDIKYYLKKAAQLDATHIESRWALVELYMQLPGILGGSAETSYQYANQLQNISEVDGWLAKGYIAVEEKDYNQAEAYYKNALKVGKSITCYEKLIQLYKNKTNEKQKAAFLLKEAKENHPQKDWSYL